MVSQILARCSLFGGIQRQTRNGSFIKEVTEVREILSSSGISPFFPSRISHYQCAFLFRYLNFASMLEYIHLAGICYIVKFYCNWQFRVALSLEFCILFLLKCLLPCSGDICQSEQNEKKEWWCPHFRNTAKNPKIRRTDVGVRIIQNWFVSKCKSCLPSWIILATRCGKIKSSICLEELKGTHKGNHDS